MSVGIDIGTSSIKVVEITGQGKNAVLKSAGAVAYTGPEIDPNMKDEKEMANMANLIKKLFKDAKITSKDVTLALPETQVFTRVMQFPLLNDQEIASAVKWEAEEYIPIPLADAIVEHQILERRETGNPPSVMVLIVAVLKSLVERYIQILELAGLNVLAVETELVSIVRSLAPEKGTVLLVDFGSKSTDIAIAKDSQVYFTRSIPTAGLAFTRAVSQGLNTNIAQAEQYKRTYGLNPSQLEGKVGTALTPIMRTIAQEIKKAIHYYQLNLKGEMPTAIIFSGGSSGMPGVTPLFTSLLGMEVNMGSPFANIKVDETAAKSLANFAPLYAVAVGLALRGD